MDTQQAERKEVKQSPWPGYLIAFYALTIGLASVLFENFANPGWGIYTRPLLGLLGVTGALLLLLRNSWGKAVLILWILAQVPLIIIDPSGELTKQAGLFLSLKATGPMSWTNGVLTEIRAYGVNLVGLGLLALIVWTISRGRFPQGPVPRWMRFLSGAIQLMLLSAFVLGLFLAYRWAKPWVDKDVVLVIDALPPGTEVYANEKRLGLTPLLLTGQKIEELGLGKINPQSPLLPANFDNGYELVGTKAHIPLWFKPPWWCIRHFQTMQTPWGVRAQPAIASSHSRSNYCRVALALKAQPGLVLTEQSVSPAECRPGEKVDFTVKLRFNPPNSLAPPHRQKEHGNRAEIIVAFWPTNAGRMGGFSYTHKTVDLPDRFRPTGSRPGGTAHFSIAGPNTTRRLLCRVYLPLLF